MDILKNLFISVSILFSSLFGQDANDNVLVIKPEVVMVESVIEKKADPKKIKQEATITNTQLQKQPEITETLRGGDGIVNKTIKIISLKGGEVFSSHSKVTITYEVSYLPKGGVNVTINGPKPLGSSAINVSSKGPHNKGKNSVIIDFSAYSLSEGNYSVSVCDLNERNNTSGNSAVCGYNNFFTIQRDDAKNSSSETYSRNTSPVNASYQAFVNGQIQVDASSVSSDYAMENCKKLLTTNTLSSIRCVWNKGEIFTYTPSLDVSVQAVPVQAPAVTLPPVPQSVIEQGAPSVRLLISPLSVPYNGGYDSFEVRTVGMKSCTLYFKDEPSNSWISGGSSLGVNYTLPGYKGLEKSRSFYVSCKDFSNTTLDSSAVTIVVGAP